MTITAADTRPALDLGAHVAALRNTGSSTYAPIVERLAELLTDHPAQAATIVGDFFNEYDRARVTASPEPTVPEVIAMLIETPDEEIQVTYTVEDWLGRKVERTVFYADGETVLACPHPACDSEEFYEHDRAERWNEMGLEDAEGDPYLSVHQKGGNFETVGFLCQSCQRPVTMPDWIELSWS